MTAIKNSKFILDLIFNIKSASICIAAAVAGLQAGATKKGHDSVVIQPKQIPPSKTRGAGTRP
ncbi:hypothetical protein RhiirA5_437834 [Rhizophagus irregularis]|uniref:Uncharacterized protein n=1 Tax=Rhizophagus irregularis TaxID=588596 RepID=A0A2N0NJZ6_9GLOM|nr:hypothetical protein RhiirA5_437834 [Rhizophagus irregularis]